MSNDSTSQAGATGTRRRSKLLGAAAMVAALSAGGVAGALLGTPGVTGAQEADDTTTSTTTSGDGTASDQDGTTEDSTTEADGADRGCGPGGRGFGGRGFGGEPGVRSEAVTEALGISQEELRTALQSGSTIAQVATAQGVDQQVVIDALVAEGTARIEERVANGGLSAEEGAERIAHLTERATEMVNAEPGSRPLRGGPGGGHRPPVDAPTGPPADEEVPNPAD